MSQRWVWTCDACGKEAATDKCYGGLQNPWMRLSISGHWMDKFGERLEKFQDRLVCSPECAKELLTKALIGMEEIQEWLGKNPDGAR